MKKRYLRDRLRELMKFDDSPHKLALAFAVGVFIAFSPWLGLHIVSAVLLAWIFRLNKVVVLTASFLNNPWTIVPMYAFCLWLGMRITGSDAAVPVVAWADLGLVDLFRILLPFIWPFVVGTLLFGMGAAVLSYFVFLWAIQRYRKSDQKDAAMS